MDNIYITYKDNDDGTVTIRSKFPLILDSKQDKIQYNGLFNTPLPIDIAQIVQVDCILFVATHMQLDN